MKNIMKKILDFIRGFIVTALAMWFLYFGSFMSISLLYFLIFNPATFEWYTSWILAILSLLICIGIIKNDNENKR